jgi:hypothetical protein
MKVFISYRREETDDLAGRFYDRLITEFGTENIFKDVDSLNPGQNWRPALEQSVAGSDVVLALIGKHWTTCVDKKGRRRLTNEDDWVRFELEVAQRSERVVMPILVKGASVPRAEELPESLRWLEGLQATEVRGDPYFNDDVARVIKKVRGLREQLAEQALLKQRTPIGAGAATESGGALVCPRCKRMCPRTDQFCEGCGAGLWDACPGCNSPVPAGQRFCKHCGVDMPKVKQAENAYAAVRARVSDIRSRKDHAERAQRGQALLQEFQQTWPQGPDDARIAELRGQLLELTCDALRAAAATEFADKRFGPALHFFERLQTLAGPSAEATGRIDFIHKQREQKLSEATALLTQGAYKQAAGILTPLQAAFPEDAQVKEAHDRCQLVLERAGKLLSSGIRELRVKRRLMELERELGWLEAQRVRAGKLTELAEEVRKKIALANATIARAVADLHAGNVKAAARLAQSVLETVADHDGALEIVRSSGGVVERVAQLEELVELHHWCAAHDLVRELEDRQLSDPRAAKLIARTRAAMADIHFSLLLFAAMLVVIIATGVFGVPWLASVISPPKGWGTSFFYYIWMGGSALVLAITWWASENKSQILRRVIALCGGGRARRRAEGTAGAVETGSGAPGPAPAQILTAEKAALPVGFTGLNEVADVIALDAGSPVPAESSQELSASQRLQRIETTAVAVEWLVLGGLAFWLAHLFGVWLVRRLATGWWGAPLIFALTAALLLPVALYVGGLYRWRLQLVLTAAGIALAFGTALAAPAGLAVYVFLLLPAVYVGVISAPLFQVPLWRGGCFALGGPLLCFVIASPLIAGFLFLAGMINAEFAFPKNGGISAIVLAALVWSTLVVLASTPSETVVKYVVMDGLIIRGICALALASALAAGGFLLVTLFTRLLNEKALFIMSWVFFFLVLQLLPPFLRWQWRSIFSLFGAVVSFVVIALIVLSEWLQPASSTTIAAWVITTTGVVLLNVKTVDLKTHGAEVLLRIRSRVRLRRLPLRIEMTRR